MVYIDHRYRVMFSDQLARSQVEQDSLGILAVMATLHQRQQQLGGVVLANRGDKP